jgi:methionyl-tRNA synthetase
VIALGPKPTEKGTGLDIVSSWEKMSKSKHNGVDPEAMLKDYGTDTTRLLILADVAPTSHRHWSSRSKCLVPHMYILTYLTLLYRNNGNCLRRTAAFHFLFL